MNSEKKSSGSKPEARQPFKGRNAPRQEGGKSSSPPAERQPRRRENNERREGGEQREGGERRERPDRQERADRPERPERQERQERPRRPQGGQAGGAERSKPAAEDKSHRPVVHVKGDIAAGSTWAKGGSGPSFADMVRQRANAAAGKPPAKEASPPAKSATPTPQQSPQPEASQATPQEAPQQAASQAPSHPTPPPPQQQQQQHEESSEEEEVMVMTAVQAAPVVVVEPIPEPPVPVPPVIPPHYVLEIERVVSVKLPPRVTQTAETQRGAYMFSAQAGKPPTPPPTVPSHAVYRPDTANLGARQWSLGTDSRIQQPPQQQAWPSAGQIDYWNSSADRAPASRPFMGAQTQAPYNSYPTTMQLSHQRPPASNTFPMRFRSSEVPESVLRQQPSAPFNRPSQATNGGGVW